MGELSRIGIAVDSDLLERFDAFIGSQGYTNRSEAFRDLIRDRLIRQSVQSPQEEVVVPSPWYTTTMCDCCRNGLPSCSTITSTPLSPRCMFI